MTATVTEKDLRMLVELLEEARRDSPSVGIPPVALELAERLVRCDTLSFNEYEPAAGRYCLEQEGSVAVVDPDYGLDDPDPFWVHFWGCPPCSYSCVSGDERTVTTISDFYSQRQWQQTGMYVDCLSRYDINHSAVVCLSSPAGRSRRLIFFRRGGSDFDERDRLLLTLLRPHLDEFYQDLQRQRQGDLGLTNRQRQLLGLLADGLSNKEIARELVVSTTTVRTHLENIFRLLNVTSRGAAVAKAFPGPPY